ncbi:MAG TPA: polysaccharide biosynthesis protein GtrA [Clostridiales bacterium]|nr:polysaccharide biosynthesis protein GtrA [Clostridiales bacterium]
MIVYDFDKTIYNGDCTLDFYFYCIRKELSLIRFLPVQLMAFIKYVLGLQSKTLFKEGFYSFLKGIRDIDLYIEEFWGLNRHKIKNWYLEKRSADDIIITASPEFLLKPICASLEIDHLIASCVDKSSGRYTGKNCHGEEKVARFSQIFGSLSIHEFYSDSLTDTPLASLSEKSFIVCKDEIIPWDSYVPPRWLQVIRTFLNREFILFLMIGTVNAADGILFSYLFSSLFNVNLALVFGYSISLTISYFLNSILAFREKLGIMKYIKFCVSYLPNFLIQNVTVLVLCNILGVHKLIGYSVAAILGIPVTFLLVKLFTFKK